MNSHLYLQNFETLKNKLSHKNPEELYDKLIQLGKKAKVFREEDKTNENKVPGCQSLMYLKCRLDENGRLTIAFSSDALISAGLAAAACDLMSHLTPEEALKADFSLLGTLGIGAALTPGRANGFGSILQKIKQEALRLLMSA